MSDQPHQPRTLSEISHLFLSGVREKAQGSNRPMRVPPAPAKPRTDLTIDLTPEEFAQVFGGEGKLGHQAAPVGPVCAVIASHLGPQQLARVQEYARYICGPGERLGLIAVDASELRLSVFEHASNTEAAQVIASESDMLDSRRMRESLDELACDVDRWLLLLPNPRAPEARNLLRDINSWTVLSACDSEGVVACYRTLKGLSDLPRPTISLATLDAPGDVESASAFQRLSGVCQQFLDWSVENEGRVTTATGVSEHVVLWCSGSHDKAQLAAAPQWQAVANFVARAGKMRPPAAKRVAAQPEAPVVQPIMQPAQPVAGPQLPETNELPQVIDLPDNRDDAASIVNAVLRGGHDLVECPIKPPMCPDARLAVSRDHRLVLLAVAGQGLSDLQQIGRAYQWMVENRPLISMAVPQMSIDAHQHPSLHLLVDHGDVSAQILQPILQASSVTVHTYRKLKWAGKTGLLVEAA